MIKNTTRLTALISILLTCLLLSACGGKKAEPVESEPVADITRPPQMVKEAPKEAVEEGDPEETISYEEWQRRRKAEADSETP